jgi:glycosyltransferase involved in cell wall biosynthesis
MKYTTQGLGLLPTGPQASKRLLVRHCGNAHPHMSAYLIKKHGFSDVCRLPQDSAGKSKAAHFKDLAAGFLYVLRNFQPIRNAQEIVAIGVMSPCIALLLKLGLLPRCRRLYWFGLFIHSPRWLKILRPAFRSLNSERIQYVLFSNFEKHLYASSLRLPEDRMFYVPYGDLSDPKASKNVELSSTEASSLGEFFFSGGDSNRDYPALIETFAALPHKLVIVCSSLNTDVDELTVPPNVKVLRDLSSELFDAYIRTSKACIIPIAHDTGAAGQSCLLRYMKGRKIIIATDTGIIREYITDGISGILVKNNREALSDAVRQVDANVKCYQNYADAAYERFVQQFSGEAIGRRLDEMINQYKEDSNSRQPQVAAV